MSGKIGEGGITQSSKILNEKLAKRGFNERGISIGGIVGLSMMVVAMILMSVIVITFNPLSIENLIRCATLTMLAGFSAIGGMLIFWMCR